MSCPSISIIQSNECVGNSLTIINDNFANLRDGICNNIDTITTIESNINSLTTQLNNLSALVTPGAARAWVNFSANKDETGAISTAGTNRLIINKYNVASVLKFNESLYPGLFQINFSSSFANTNYGVIATCSEKAASSGNFVWVQPSLRDTNYVQIYIRSINTSDIANPDYVSVIII